MGFWSKLGKFASIAAPIAAAPFTGGASLALIGAGAGVANAALNKQGWKGMALGAGMGMIPGMSGAGKAAGAIAPTLGAGLKSAGTAAAMQYGPGAALGIAGKAAGGGGGGGAAPAGGAGGVGGGAEGGGGSNFWRNAAPIITQGAGMVAGAYAGKKATDMAQQRSPEELAALGGARGGADALMGAGDDLSGVGSSLTKQGQNYLQQPANYYQTLLSGNRAAMQNATAPASAQISGNYRGANRALEHSGIQGAGRDVATADLNRQRVSQIASLTTGQQGGAADALAKMGDQSLAAGSAAFGQGTAAYANAGNIYGNLLGDANSNRRYAREEGGKTSAAIGGLVRDLGEATYRPKAAGAGATPAAAAAKGIKAPALKPLPGRQPQGPGITAPPLVSGQLPGQQAGIRWPGNVTPPWANQGGNGTTGGTSPWGNIRF